VDIDSSGIKKFVIDVINSITMQSGLPNQASLSLSSLDLDDYTSTLGVIGRKGEKIIMGMIIKKPNDPHRLLFLSHTTKTASHLTFRMVENE
jgi:hypothetical protein